MGNQNKGNLEKYTAAHWRGIPDRSRGPKKAPASKFKREFARWLDKAPDLTTAEKRVGRFLVEHYNEHHRPHGCAWPSRKYMAEELGHGAATVRKATNTLHKRGYIHKVVGGGWHRGKIRHRSSEYLPAFSRIANPETWALMQNAPHLSENNGEDGSIPPEYGVLSPRGPSDPLSDSGFSQSSAEVRGPIDPPRSESVVANAIASPDTPNGSTASLAPAPESEEDDSPKDYEIISLASEMVIPGVGPILVFGTITAGQDLSENTRVGLDMFAPTLTYQEEKLEGDEYDILITRDPGDRPLVGGLPTGVWRAELQNLEPLSDSSRIKLAFRY